MLNLAFTFTPKNFQPSNMTNLHIHVTCTNVGFFYGLSYMIISSIHTRWYIHKYNVTKEEEERWRRKKPFFFLFNSVRTLHFISFSSFFFLLLFYFILCTYTRYETTITSLVFTHLDLYFILFWMPYHVVNKTLLIQYTQYTIMITIASSQVNRERKKKKPTYFTTLYRHLKIIIQEKKNDVSPNTWKLLGLPRFYFPFSYAQPLIVGAVTTE